MKNVISDRKGNYILVMRLNKGIQITIPRFGVLELFPGDYFYCGSAHGSGGIKSRVLRHLNIHAKRFWHIDYLKNHMQILEIWYQVDPNNQECEFCQFLVGQNFSSIPIEGFGSSDCKKRCMAHLIKLPKNINLDRLYQELKIIFDEMYRYFPNTV
jgi:Uri superfamily endonuclease